MKKNYKFILAVMLWGLLKSNNIHAQITYQHTFYRWEAEWFITDIGNNDYKYIFQDSSGFKIYNLDYSLYQYVKTPIPLWEPPSYYEIAYVTKSLFDCDSTNIEYVITAPTGPGNFYIYRTDGTLLFEKDSTTGPYFYGAADGSIPVRPIFNTPSGSRLWLITGYRGDSIVVYSLCGTLPDLVLDLRQTNQDYIQLFPNPSSGVLTFKINLPDNSNQYDLVILNNIGEEIYKEKINSEKDEYIFDAKSLSAGIYFYSLCTKNKPFKTGKFILTK